MILRLGDIVYVYSEGRIMRRYGFKNGIYKATIKSFFRDEDIIFEINDGCNKKGFGIPIKDIDKTLFNSVEELKEYRKRKLENKIKKLEKMKILN